MSTDFSPMDRDSAKVSASRTISHNILANFVGTFWTALMGPALVTVYVALMGIEAYALVGILTTLQTAFTLLDLGLSAATNRELARLSTQPESAQESRDLVRTAEIIYWVIALLIGGIMGVSSGILARHWVRPEALTSATVEQAFLLMGLILAMQFPFALYSGGLNGLQRQVLLNTILVITATLRGVGSVALLGLVSPTIQTFFAWQFVVTVIQTALAAIFLWQGLPHGNRRARFSSVALRRTWYFAAGMMGISFFALLVVQADKVVLSRLLTLENFGYYTLATVVASSVSLFSTPVFAAVFPRFSQLMAIDNQLRLRELYHHSAQALSLILLPCALIVALFAPEILMVWLRDPITVANVYPLVRLIVIGTALNGLMQIPYALQLAAGWTTLPLYQNIVAVVILVPCLFYVTNRFGAIGAAWIWIIVNAGYVLIGVQIMHTRLLPGEKWRWYLQDIGLPLCGVLVTALIGRWLFPAQSSIVRTFVQFTITVGIVMLTAIVLTPLARGWIYNTLRYGRSSIRAETGTS